MSKLKNRLMKRVLALVLSGAMIMSDAALFQMTAFAAEETTEGYSEEPSEENKPEAAELTVKEDGDSDEKDADEGNVADDAADDDKNDGAADNAVDDDKDDDAADIDAADDEAAGSVEKVSEDAEEDSSKAENSGENAIVAESEAEKPTTVETIVEDDPQEAEVEEKTEEEASEVEVTEEVIDNQASSKKFSSTSDNLTAGTPYGDNILKFSVLENMSYKTNSASSYKGTSYAGPVVGTTNPYVGISDTPDEKGEYKGINPSDTDGWIPDRGAAFKIETILPSTITFVIAKAGTETSRKTYYFIKDDGSKGEKLDSGLVPLDATSECTIDLDAGQTYYFYVAGSKVSVYEIKWEEREVEIDESTRTPWGEVAKPVIAKPVIDETDPSKINVTVTGDVSKNGADSMKVSMYKADAYNAESTENEVIDSLISAQQQNETTFTFAPTESGTYIFKAELTRKTQTEPIPSEMSEPIDFTCPLLPPTNLTAESLGGGKVQVKWDAVPEVGKYIVEIKDKANPDNAIPSVEDTKASAVVSGLTINKTYTFTVYSVKVVEGTEQKSAPSESIDHKVTDLKVTWSTIRYGNGVDKNNNKSTKISDNSVRLVSSAGKGKIVPASTDGVLFYYTTVPSSKNFTFTARAHVNSWEFSNGQEGFGVMAADRIGSDGDSSEFWNNSYQAMISRISYRWNGVDISSDDTGEKIEMQIGVGSTEKVGVTQDDLSKMKNEIITVPEKFSAVQTSIDSTYAKYGAGTYNIVANCKNKEERTDLTSKDYEEYENFELQVQKNNTGYFVSYTKVDNDGDYILDADGNKITTTKKYYDPSALSQLKKDTIYVGVFTSRNADITFSNMTLETIDPEVDAKAEEKEVTYYNLAANVLSSTVTNTSDYQFIFHSNWNGKFVLKDSAGNILSKHTEKDSDGNEKELDYYNVTGSLDPKIRALQDGFDSKNTKIYIDLDGLLIGQNVFTVEYTPDKSWCPDKDEKTGKRYAELNSYNKVKFTYTVEYRKYGEPGQTIYVSQYGKSTNIGTKESPLDIYTAVKYAQPGQTILLAGGRYSLNRTLQTPRGVDGKPDTVNGKETYNNYIKMMADPEEMKEKGDKYERPVLDFNSLVPAVVTVGNYWYFKNFDVTRCKDGEKGIQVSSSYCVFDRVDTYKNGSTGLQISRLASQDTYQDWPSNNLILNCNSYLNIDSGYEDADGFAAKLTSGSNNVFDGCIAAFNADDGWDLFAKVQSGSIGGVTIKNSLAYRNGYVLEKNGEQGNFDEFGKRRKGKGNGNGFKMGGDGVIGGSIYDTDEDGNNYYEKYGKYMGHRLYNSYAFYNKAKGFDSNSCPNVKAYNSVSFNNGDANIGFSTAAKNMNTDYELKNVISFRTDGSDTSDEIKRKTKGKTTTYKEGLNTTTYLWNGSASKNSNGDKISAGDFESLTYESLDCVDKKYWRNPDGTVNLHGFLQLKESSSSKAEPSMGGTVSNEVEENIGDDTNGSITGAVDSGDDDADYGADYPDGGIKDYYGKIWVADIEYLDYTYREPIEYTGKQIMPELHVYFSADTALLRKGKDYTVKYENNINAGTAIAHVTGVGSYKGFTVDKTFTIKKISMKDTSIAIPSVVAVATGTDPKKLIKPTWQGKALKENKDYTIETINATTLKVVGVGNFGSNDPKNEPEDNYKEVTIQNIDSVPVEKQLNKATVKIKNSNNITYTGSKIDLTKEDVEVKLNGNSITEGFKVECSNNLEVGKATLTVIGDGVNYFGSKSVNFTIKKGNLKDIVDVTYRGGSIENGANLGDVTFNGKDCAIGANEFKLSLKADKTVYLKNGIDYKIVQKGTNKAGTASVTIKGINGCTGSVQFKFKIEAFDISKIGDTEIKNYFDCPDLSYIVGGAKHIAGSDFQVKLGGNTVDSRHYSLSYRNNTMVGTKSDAKAPTVIVTGRNGLKGKKEITFNITPAEMTENTDIAVSAKDIATNGKPLKYSDLKRPVITVTQSYVAKGKIKTKKLSAGRDYDKTQIHYYIDTNNNCVLDDAEIKNAEVTDKVLSNAKDTVSEFEKNGGYVTVLVRVGDDSQTQENTQYNYKGYVDGYFRAALYDINKAKFVNKKSRVYGTNWKTGNGLSVTIDWSDTEVARLEDYIDIRYKIPGDTSAEDSSLTDKEKQEIAKLGRKLDCNDRIGDYKLNTNNAAKYYAMPGFVIDTASYKKNDRVGTASFTIVGTGMYAGTKKITFKIVNKETAKKMIKNNKGDEVEPFKYRVMVTTGENGTAKANGTYAIEGKTVTLTASPNKYVDENEKEHYYAVDKWQILEGDELVTDFQINEVDQFTNSYQFKMPEGNVSVKVTFGEGYKVTVASGGNGTVANGKSEASTTAMEGRTVTLTVKPKDNYCVDDNIENWKLSGVTASDIKKVGDNKYQFKMPKGNVSVKAVFKKVDA